MLLVAVVPSTSAGAGQLGRAWDTQVGALLAKLHDPAATASDYFGLSVAISGTAAIVGASGTGGEAGAGYIYVKGASGWPNKPTVTLADPASTANDMFGSSVAMSGTTILVGAPGTGGGVAYFYVKGPSGWPDKPTATLADPEAEPGDDFGISVAVYGKTAVVGAFDNSPYMGAAYIYVKGTSGWPKKPTISLSDPAKATDDFFGGSVTVSGTTAIVGASGTSAEAGAAYIYVKGTSGWPNKPTLTLVDPGSAMFGNFGSSVAVSGGTAIIGAAGYSAIPGTTYIYVKDASGWPKKPTVTLSDPAATAGDVFGHSVGVSGTIAVVGAELTASSAGAAYIYVQGASGWPTTPTSTLADPAATSGDFFGNSVAVSGKTAVVGAWGASSRAGKAYIYKS
jgi:hypothetical protein